MVQFCIFLGEKEISTSPKHLRKKAKLLPPKLIICIFCYLRGTVFEECDEKGSATSQVKSFFLHLLWKEVLVGLVVRSDHHLTPTVFQTSDVLLLVSIEWTFSWVFQREKESVKNEVHAIVCAHAFWGQNVFCKTQATHAHIPTTVSLTPDVLLRANTIQFTFK